MGHLSPLPFPVGLAAADSDAQPVQCLRQAGGLDVLPSSLWWCSVTQLLLSWFCGGQVSAISSACSATSSERRNAPAKPNASSARPRLPVSVSGQSASICFSTSAVAGALPHSGGADGAADAAQDCPHPLLVGRTARGRLSCGGSRWPRPCARWWTICSRYHRGRIDRRRRCLRGHGTRRIPKPRDDGVVCM